MHAAVRFFAIPLGTMIAAACAGAVVPDTTPFSCHGLTCDPGEYCRGQLPGTGAAPSFRCDPLPAACASDATCDCVKADVPMGPSADCFGVSCNDDGQGHVTLQCGGE